MFNQTTKLSSNQGYQPQVSNSNSKSLAGASESQVQTAQSSALTLDQWKAAAQVWFDKAHGKIALEKGETMPTQAEYAQMTEYWNWANQQSGGWNPSMGGAGQGMPAQNIPPGAKIGAMGNIFFNGDKVETTHVSSKMPIDVDANEFTLNIDQSVQDVIVEKTKDTRTNPAVDVIKITVKKSAKYAEAGESLETIYYVEADAKVNVNTIDGKGVTQKGTDALKLADGTAQITIGTVSEQSADSAATGVTGGETKKTDPSHWTHTANANDKLEYIPNKDAVETEYHTFYGETIVSVPPDCTIDITENSKGDLVFTIKNREGKAISEGTVPDGFPLRVNHANEKSITINGSAIKAREDEKDAAGKVIGQIIKGGLEGLNINGTKTQTSAAQPIPPGKDFIVATALNRNKLDAFITDVPAANPVLKPVPAE